MTEPGYTHRVTFQAGNHVRYLWGRRWCRSWAEGWLLAVAACAGLPNMSVTVTPLSLHA